MSGLERLPERALSEEIKERLRAPIELKGSAQSLGSSSVITHRIFSQEPFDVQLNPSGTAGVMRLHRVDVEFIPNDTTFGGAFCLNLGVRARNLSGGVVDRWAISIERKKVVGKKQAWSVYYSSFGYAEDAIRLKFFLFALGSGTFKATVIT